MPVNLDKPQNWKADVALSVDMYNDWFMNFAPTAFRQTRVAVTVKVEDALKATEFLRDIEPATLRRHPEILPTLRMSTCPPIAVDRLIGLAGVSKNLVKCMEEDQRRPMRMTVADADAQLGRACRAAQGADEVLHRREHALVGAPCDRERIVRGRRPGQRHCDPVGRNRLP